jgi:hypothetical protein
MCTGSVCPIPIEEIEMAGSWWSKLFGGNGLPGPQQIPQPVGTYLVTVLKKDPDWTWKLRAVVRPRGEKKGVFDVRVFDSLQAQDRQVVVSNFDSLEGHRELTLFEGWFDKKTNYAEVVEKIQTAA